MFKPSSAIPLGGETIANHISQRGVTLGSRTDSVASSGLGRDPFEANFESCCGIVPASFPNPSRDPSTHYKAPLNVAKRLCSREPKLSTRSHLNRLKRKSASARLHGGNSCESPLRGFHRMVRESNPRQPELWSGALSTELTELGSFV